jgi:epoxyqueuosine reductase QueG
LGKRGKSTVVLHPGYGSRLRFMAIKADAPLELITDSAFTEEENPVCNGCSICIDICPTKALEAYRMPDPSLCLSNITPLTEDGRSILCDKCLYLCPTNT